MSNFLSRHWQQTLGVFDYFLQPKLRTSWGGPFNGQRCRQAMFAELITKVPFDCIVETGTFRGTTTEFLQSESGLPVHTVEFSPRFYSYSRCRLRNNLKVETACNDSRTFLRELSMRSGFSGNSTLFYLDAHWGADLPLREEAQLIFETWPKSVIMVDDFQVPGDAGYTYDDYGGGNALTLDYLQPLTHYGFDTYFPAAGSDSETGATRGTVVITTNREYAALLDTCSHLKRHTMDAARVA